MKYPWEIPKLDYQTFMDTHVRVSIFIDNELKGSFAIVDDGTNMDVKTVMPDGRQLVFKNGGHPRTTDQRMTVMELVNYVLENYK
jgi:hypothetical protein